MNDNREASSPNNRSMADIAVSQAPAGVNEPISKLNTSCVEMSSEEDQKSGKAVVDSEGDSTGDDDLHVAEQNKRKPVNCETKSDVSTDTKPKTSQVSVDNSSSKSKLIDSNKLATPTKSERGRTESPVPKKTPVSKSAPTPPKKSSKGNTKKPKDSEEDGEDSKLPDKVALLERSPQVSGKRERKKTERLDISASITPKEKKLEIPEGNGVKLGDILIADKGISKANVDLLKVIHKVLFGHAGSKTEVRRHIRQFNGWDFAKESSQYEKKVNYLKENKKKITISQLKKYLSVFSLERTGTRDQLIDRLLSYLHTPVDSGKVPTPKRKRGKTVKGKQKGAKRRRTNSSGKKGSDDDDDDDDDDDEEDNDEEEKESDESEASESDDEKKPKKAVKRRPAQKKATPKKKEPAKGKKASKKETSSDDDNDDNDETSGDDEPLSKLGKPAPPTDNDLKAAVKKLLEGANLEEVTMKSICKQVFAKYPDFDLSDRKDFIKETVKSVIT